MRTGWAAMVAAMLLAQNPAHAAGLDDLIGEEFSLAVVALDGDTLLVVGYQPDVPGAEITGPQREVKAILPTGEAQIRLWGVSAPEFDAPGGWRSLSALDELLAARPAGLGGYWVTCTGADVHRASSGAGLFARCESGLFGTGGGDLGFAMIYGGWATADRTVTWADPTNQPDATAYDAAQRASREARRGLWAFSAM